MCARDPVALISNLSKQRTTRSLCATHKNRQNISIHTACVVLDGLSRPSVTSDTVSQHALFFKFPSLSLPFLSSLHVNLGPQAS